MIGITSGDPNGVGPEILLRAYQSKKLLYPSFTIGDYEVLKYCNNHLHLEVPLYKMTSTSDMQSGYLNVLDAGILSEKDLSIGKISAKGGQASLKYIDRAVELAIKGDIEAIVTLPVNKEAIRIDKKNFKGHTDYIAAHCNVSNFCMMLVSDKLIVTHLSTHLSLKEALGRIKKERIIDVIRLTHDAVSKLRPRVRIAVAGLNPHAGEHGAFGTEEMNEIEPAVLEARSVGMDIYGPVPPDTVFVQAVHGKFDAVVCMYHDQGHIPMKLLDFENAVNVTLGLPVLRTSVDHGTAYDIAYQGKASIQSFCYAFRLAQQLMSADFSHG
ncbi:MAG: 4-hydroxythreonine-4-phosphate dehydrogenase [Bacteroides sp. SM23_62_1]|nr:MAG: 4-hydroxythreonine-4-phosphate dehydrogenase [Bacteroides sp. SM23_62_1]